MQTVARAPLAAALVVVGVFLAVAGVGAGAMVFGVNAWPFSGEWCCGSPETVWQWFEYLPLQVGFATLGAAVVCVGWAVRPGSRRTPYNWNRLPAAMMVAVSVVVFLNLYYFLSRWLQFAPQSGNGPWEGSVVGEVATGVAVFLLIAVGLAYGASWFRKRARRGE
jgi:hypothetical protein